MIREVHRLSEDLIVLASSAGELNELRLNRDIALRQIDFSEKNTQVRINEIFVDIRHPAEEEGPEKLEGVLREVITLFSNLSILVSSMRRDFVKANRLLRRMEGIFKSWEEKPLGWFPTNSSKEINYFKHLIAPFKDFINRVEALRVQLSTVLALLISTGIIKLLRRR